MRWRQNRDNIENGFLLLNNVMNNGKSGIYIDQGCIFATGHEKCEVTFLRVYKSITKTSMSLKAHVIDTEDFRQIYVVVEDPVSGVEI